MPDSQHVSHAGLQRRRTELEEHYEDQMLWLQEVASILSSSGEQQRIASDLDATRKELNSIDEQIRIRALHA